MHVYLRLYRFCVKFVLQNEVDVMSQLLQIAVVRTTDARILYYSRKDHIRSENSYMYRI